MTSIACADLNERDHAALKTGKGG
ncbi:MAG: hypothetical protein H6Q10_3452, partial [Acidobacteria bacterium]|nr:hypothetical protein [Acidobacteriota bacterium]